MGARFALPDRVAFGALIGIGRLGSIQVSASAVFPVQGSLPSGLRSYASSNILGAGYKLKMEGAAAGSVTAQMIDDKLRRDFPVPSSKGQSVWKLHRWTQLKGPVSIFFNRGDPQPATLRIFNLNLRPEPSRQGYIRKHLRSLA